MSQLVKLYFKSISIEIGGSVCMEMLTRTGWNRNNQILGTLMQIKTSFMDGGARLEMGPVREYTEREAWIAFERAARTHNWDIRGFNLTKFPKAE
jgi:ubiquitin-conjugating enzyme E2 Q